MLMRRLSFSTLAPSLALALLSVPVLCGFIGTLLPALGYLPALGGTQLSGQPIADLLAQPGLWRSARMAFYVGLISGVISLTLVAAFVAAWHGHATFRRMQTIVSPLLAVPHAAAALGLAFMIAPSGFIARLFSPWLTGWDRPPDILIVNDPMALSLIAGLVVKEVPFLLLVTMAALPQIPVRRLSLLSASLGYGQMAGFLLSVWPLIYRQIRLAVFAVLAYASSNVDMAIILGPGTPATLPVRLVQWMNDPDLTTRFMACAGACLQIVLTAILLAVWVGLERFTKVLATHLAHIGWRARRDWAARQLARLAMAASALIVFGGLIMMAIWSVAGLWRFPHILPERFSVRTWTQVSTTITDHVLTTVQIGLIATVLSVILVVGCLLRENETGRSGGQRALALLYLPLLVPQVGFLFGLQFFFIYANADATFLALVVAHMVFVLPYVFLSLSAPWRAYDRRYERVAIGLGASPKKVFWSIRLPMLLRAVLAASAVGFAVSVSQYLPTLLIGAGRFSTVTTEAISLATGGNTRIVGVYAFLQMALPFIGFALATTIPALLFRNRRAISAQ